jgi:hypothetical protein
VCSSDLKLLKEKGFDEISLAYYHSLYMPPDTLLITNSFDKNSKIGKESFIAPEQWQVIEWLRINHSIYITIKVNYKNIDGDTAVFNAIVTELNYNNKRLQREIIMDNFFDTPQEAYSSAFDFILKNNLI